MPTKTSMALMGAGAFTIALAVLVPVAIAPVLEKAPAKENVTTHSRSAAKILNPATGQLEDATVDLTRVISPAVNGKGGYLGSSDVAVYHELLSLARVGADGDVQATDARGRYTGLDARESTIAFDRSTGAGKTNVYGETWHTTGQTVKFPFGTKKQTYQYFEQISKRAWPVSYSTTTKVKGLEVYVFKGTVPQVSLGQYGVLTGTDTLYSNNGITVYVEPVTGSIISSETAPQTSIKFADGKVSPALLVDNLIPTDATIADRVAAAKSDKSKVETLKAAPYVLGLLGLLLLAGGLYLSRRRRAGQPGEPSERPDVSGKLPTPRAEPAVDPARLRH